MQNSCECVSKYLVGLVEYLRVRILDKEFIARHRLGPKDFTRKRVLTFSLTMIFILQHTVKSLQRHLHEFFQQLKADMGLLSAKGSAWTQARAKLKHTAFIELNQACVLPARYESQNAPPVVRWHGFRVLSVDSSILRLPMWEDTAEAFGLVEITNQTGAIVARYPQARISVLYDVHNRFGLEGIIKSSSIGEVEMAWEHMLTIKSDDLVLWDRGYTGYEHLARCHHHCRHYVGRCSTASFLAAQELFKANQEGVSKIVWLKAPQDQRRRLKSLGLPLRIQVRFVTVRLSTGDLEVLVTSLLDEQLYPTAEFALLYHCRWGIETYYFLLKSRLSLENFSGKTAESIRQDFHAAVLLANLESLLSVPAQEKLQAASQDTKYVQQVNRADSYHALKLLLLDLLYRDVPAQEVVGQLMKWFQDNPVRTIPDRIVPRTTPSFNRSDHFQRRVKKTVF